MKIFRNFLYASFFAAICYLPLKSAAQIVIEPLFEYPSAPDSIASLADRSNFLMLHFWDKMNFNGKQTVDQNALNDAFSVYMSALRFADVDMANESMSKLIAAYSKNPALSIQFTRAAEETLYGPRADFWSDEVYLKFVDALMANKKVKNERKARFQRHATLLRNSLVGSVPPRFNYTTPVGSSARFLPNGVITVIEFGNPDCDECRLSKLKMETDVKFSSLVDRGMVNVLFIIPDPSDGWQTQLAEYSPKWHVGASDDVADIFDLRNTPAIYVVGRKGQIIAKNIPVAEAMMLAVEEADNI